MIWLVVPESVTSEQRKVVRVCWSCDLEGKSTSWQSSTQQCRRSRVRLNTLVASEDGSSWFSLDENRDRFT